MYSLFSRNTAYVTTEINFYCLKGKDWYKNSKWILALNHSSFMSKTQTANYRHLTALSPCLLIWKIRRHFSRASNHLRTRAISQHLKKNTNLSLMSFKAISATAVHDLDAIKCSQDEKGSSNAYTHWDQHPRHVSCLRKEGWKENCK